MNIGNLKIGTRLGTGFAIVIALMVAMAVVGIGRINAVNNNTEVIVHDLYVKVALAQTIENEVNKQSRALRTALIASAANDATVAQSELAKIEESAPVITKVLEKLQVIVQTDTGKEDIKVLLAARSTFKQHEHRLIELIKANQIEESRVYLIKQILPPQGVYLSAINAFSQTQTKNMEQFSVEAAEMTHSANISMLALVITATLLAGAMGFVLTRSITLPLRQAVKVAQTVAAGDLTSHIEITTKDETGQLLQALKEMNDSLVGIINEVRSGTDTIATASGQIAAGNMDLSSRTEQQASALEETASSMEELNGTVKQNADNARQANQLAASAAQVALKGGAVVSQVVGTMASINDSSHKIVDIISVIDGIAFQTNILALNAAVEAARAGEQGRGFAVVATEVRNLAQRSAAAAKEIKTLIGDSVEKIDVGAKLVDQAGATMQEIVNSVKHVTDVMREIMAASNEQSTGIEEVNQAIMQMDEVTQQNAALVEEAAAATASLQEQAENIVHALGIFKTNGMQTKGTAPSKTVSRSIRVTTPLATATGNDKSASLKLTQRKHESKVSAADGWEEF